MKETFIKDFVLYESENANEFEEFPFDKELLALLKRENPFPQTYFIAQKGDSRAYFIMYKMRMNVLTFGKKSLYMNIKVIGLPCSLSEQGFNTNDIELFLKAVKSIKGIKLVLNAYEKINNKAYIVGETLPTCVFKNNFQTIDEYMLALRSSYRRRIKLAMDKCRDFEVIEIADNYAVYDLYLNTYNKSDYKLEKLEKDFFTEADALKLGFIKDGQIRGFVMLKITGDMLTFMLCGMDYNYETADLYYFMLYTIIEIGIKHKVKFIDLGQTSEATKLKFGASLHKRFFYANHSNPIINFLAKGFKGILEYKYKFPEYRVFREDNNEGTFSKTGI